MHTLAAAILKNGPARTACHSLHIQLTVPALIVSNTHTRVTPYGPFPPIFCHINLTQSVLWVVSIFMFSPISENENEMNRGGWRLRTPQDSSVMAHSGETGSSCQVSVDFLPGLVKSLLLRRLQREREDMSALLHRSQVQDGERGGGGFISQYRVQLSICCTSL